MACRRAHGATGGATQEEPFARPRGALSRPHGARGRESGRRPRRARRTGRRPLDAARRPRPAAGRPRPSRRAPAPGARRRGRCTRGAGRAARPSPADGSRGLGRPARNVPRRPPATRSRRGWRAPAPGRRGDAGPRGAPEPRRPRRPRPRPRGHPISRASQNARAACAAFLQRFRRRTRAGRAESRSRLLIREWGRRWRATALERRKCAKPLTRHLSVLLKMPRRPTDGRAAADVSPPDGEISCRAGPSRDATGTNPTARQTADRVPAGPDGGRTAPPTKTRHPGRRPPRAPAWVKTSPDTGRNGVF